jgi:hypothetical protein
MAVTRTHFISASICGLPMAESIVEHVASRITKLRSPPTASPVNVGPAPLRQGARVIEDSRRLGVGLMV